MEEVKILLDKNKDAEMFVHFNLHKYNQNHCEYIKEHSSYAHNYKINGDFILYDGDEVIGGALGSIMWGWYYLSDIYINEKYRKNGVGSKLIKKIEDFSRENGAIGVRIDSWSFQAPKFYQKLGYIVWGEFKDCPPGTTHYYMYKRFDEN